MPDPGPDKVSPSRRALLLGALAGLAARPAGAQARRRFVAGGFRGHDNLLAMAEATGAPREIRPLPGRAHSVVALRGRGEVIAVARRADRWALALNPDAPDAAASVAPAEGHINSGHVAVSPDGALAAFVEIRVADGVGFLSLREVGGAWREIARLGTGGAGPHMALWLDERHIAVGNGGYYDVGEVKAPDGRIGASLGIIDHVSGRPAAIVPAGADYAAYSLRHLARAPEGLVVALPRVAPDGPDTPPAALWRGGPALEPLPGPPAAEDPLRRYCGDVAVTAEAILVSSVRAGTVGGWRRADRAWLGAVAMPSCGALAVDEDGAGHVATEDGLLSRLAWDPAPRVAAQRRSDFGWDNHATFL